MGVLDAVYRQFQKPSGLLGRFAGWIMATRPSNVERNRWTVDLLKIGATDHVLEIGFGPGLSIANVARLAPGGRVIGVDHSALMLTLATQRNLATIKTGAVELRLGGLELLPQLGEAFDKVFSVNVFQFLTDRVGALKTIRSVMKPGATLAVTYQPRHRGATAKDAHEFAARLSKEMTDAGFRDIGTELLDLQPMPVTCVLGRT